MDSDPREDGDSIVCHIYSIVFSLEVLRRLERISLGGLKCGINVLECALWSQEVTSTTLRTARLFEENQTNIGLFNISFWGFLF